uniref:PLP-dependent aminotransferase family protein n=1 Tax=Piscinibacter sp. TaxID=1903157 RepID=UPI003784FC90
MFDSASASPLPGALPLSREADSTLTEQLAARFAERIRARLLAPGARLPSVRECARRHEVSPTTVVAAYDQLLAQGLVEARAQRGFFVRAPLGDASAPGAARSPAAPRSPVPISATTLIRGMFQPPGAQPMPGLGTLPVEWLDPALLAGAMRKVSAQLGRSALQYGEPAGEARLRRALAARLVEHGIAAGAEQIVTTVGATHALDIVTRTLLKPGESVLVDEPGWSVEYARLAALGMRVLPVPRTAHGPDLDVMARYCEAHAPRLFVSVSVLHNPTGHCLAPGSAHRVLQLANTHRFHIVEDDTYSHIAPQSATRLCALDGLQRTIYVSGFAK